MNKQQAEKLSNTLVTAIRKGRDNGVIDFTGQRGGPIQNI
jgi:hypothetical protein